MKILLFVTFLSGVSQYCTPPVLALEILCRLSKISTTDNGKDFTGESLKKLCNKNNVKIIHSRPIIPVIGQGKQIIKYLKTSNV